MKNLHFIALAALMVFGSSCQDVVDDLNVNPNEFTEVPASLVFNHLALNSASVAEAEPARIAGMWSDQFAGTAQQYIPQDGYEVNSALFDVIWESLYQAGIAQAQIAGELATEEGNTLLANLSRVYEGYYAAEAALMFGDVPFSQVNKLEFPDPVYDSQRDVLNSAISILEEAARGEGGDSPVSSANGVYSSTATWGNFANALAARYRLALRDYSGALTAAQNANFNDFTSSVEIVHTSDNFAENLFWQFEVEQRGGYLTFGLPNSGASSLVNFLNNRGDDDDKTDDAARLALFSTFVDNDNFLNLNVDAGGFFAVDASFPVIGFPEVQLIIAECAAREGEEDTAIEALNAAREYWDDRTGTDSYQDYDGDDLSGDDLLNAILVEKYVSVFGLPTYYDIQRTDNLIGADMDTRDTPAQRFLYPSTEEASNSSYPGLLDIGVPTPINE